MHERLHLLAPEDSSTVSNSLAGREGKKQEVLNCSERKRVWCLDILGDFASWTFSAVKIGDIVDVMLVRENLLQITDVPHVIS